MSVLLCEVKQSDSSVERIAFEVHPHWSLSFMLNLVLFFFRHKLPHLLDDAISVSYSKLSNFELEEKDLYIDLIYYSEEVYDALLCYPGQH